MRDEVLIEVIYHLMVAKDAKVENKDGICGGLSGLCVIRFSRYKKRPEGDCPSGLKTNQDFATSF